MSDPTGFTVLFTKPLVWVSAGLLGVLMFCGKRELRNIDSLGRRVGELEASCERIEEHLRNIDVMLQKLCA